MNRPDPDDVREQTLAQIVSATLGEISATKDKIERDNKAANDRMFALIVQYRTDINKTYMWLYQQVATITDTLAHEAKERPDRQRVIDDKLAKVDAQIEVVKDRQERFELLLMRGFVVLLLLLVVFGAVAFWFGRGA